MLILSLFLWLRALLPGEAPSPGPALFPFAADATHWGYLDAAGHPVIEARFQAAQPFAEGLAAVREQGRYGYLAPDGQLRVPAIYDYATPFRGGYALVWLQGHPLVLNQQGQVQFRHSYASLQLVPGPGSQPPTCLVSTHSGKQGITDVRGKLLADTVFRQIQPFQSGVSVVTGLRHGQRRPVPDAPEDSTAINEVGVIDRLGHWRVPFGRYEKIEKFAHGYALAHPSIEDERENWEPEVLLDSTGRECYAVPSKAWMFPYGGPYFAEGVAPTKVYLVRPDTVKVWSSDKRYDFASVVDTRGRLQFRNPDLDRILPFAHGRSFAQTQDKKWHLIDARGRFVTTQDYEQVVSNPDYRLDLPPFYHGRAFVKTSTGKVVGLDTAGRVVVPARSFDFEYDAVYWQGDFLIFREDISEQDSVYSYRYGFWRPGSNLVVAPRFHDLASLLSFTPGSLLAVMQSGRSGYLDAAGRLVWQQPQPPASAPTRDVDYMARAVYTVASEPLEKYAGIGGWAGSRNGARRAKSGQFPRNRCSVTVEAQATPGRAGQEAGHRVQIANTTADTLVFDAQDSMIYLSLEARDEQGRWRAIEYVPQSWCGNSYHQVFLAPRQYWQLTVPAYRGSIPTRLRARLVIQADRRAGTQKVVYSNEFAGSVNPAQFWRQAGYQPAGLMDPYNN